MANGFYASTILVVPSGDNGNQGASIPVCLEVGNNIVPQFATIIPPTVVPPPFAGAPGFFGSAPTSFRRRRASPLRSSRLREHRRPAW